MTVQLLNPSTVRCLDRNDGPWRTLRIHEPNHAKHKSGVLKGLYKQTCVLELSFESEGRMFAFAEKLAAAVAEYKAARGKP